MFTVLQVDALNVIITGPNVILQFNSNALAAPHVAGKIWMQPVRRCEDIGNGWLLWKQRTPPVQVSRRKVACTRE